MVIELANDGSADGSRDQPEGSGELLEQALHNSPRKVGEGYLSDAPAGRAIPQAGGRPVSRCGLEPFRRGDDLRARQRRGPVGWGPGPSRDGPLDDLFIRLGRGWPAMVLANVVPRRAAQDLAPRPVLGEFAQHL